MTEKQLTTAIECATDCIGNISMQLAAASDQGRHALLDDLKTLNANLSKLVDERKQLRRATRIA